MHKTTIPLGLYQHYKGHYYQVLGLARHSETLEELVVYQALYGDYGLWVRPIGLFTEVISYDAKQVPRFQFVQDTVCRVPNVRDDNTS